jgi:GAF domain-containing protein
MSSVIESKPQSSQNLAEMSSKLEFQRKLQAVTNKIHATANIDELMLELSQDICALFDADRLTIYALAEDKQSIVSKVKTGLASFKDLKLNARTFGLVGFALVSSVAIAVKTKPAFVLVWLLGAYVVIALVETMIAVPRGLAKRRRDAAERTSIPPTL